MLTKIHCPEFTYNTLNEHGDFNITIRSLHGSWDKSYNPPVFRYSWVETYTVIMNKGFSRPGDPPGVYLDNQGYFFDSQDPIYMLVCPDGSCDTLVTDFNHTCPSCGYHSSDLQDGLEEFQIYLQRVHQLNYPFYPVSPL